MRSQKHLEFQPDQVGLAERRLSSWSVVGVVLALTMVGGGIASGQSTGREASQDSSVLLTLADAQELCVRCIDLRQVVVIGDTVGDGYIENTRDAVLDSLGRYWIAQGSVIKVFDAEGRFVRTVGREGRGPMEFSAPLPVFTDAGGRVHIVDPGNLRETIVDADFQEDEERPFPWTGVRAVVRLPGHGGYAVNMWLPTADAIGLPIHVVADGKVQHSFGVSEGTTAQDAFTSLRLLAVDSAGRIFTSKRFDYEIEAWTNEGRRVLGLAGPKLNKHPVRPTFFDFDDNPIPNEILAIQVDGANWLWVLSKRVKENWQQHFRQRVYPNGLVGLQLKPGEDIHAVFGSRIEVIDVTSHTVLARRDYDTLFLAFLGRGMLLESRSLKDGTPQVAVWHIQYHEQN